MEKDSYWGYITTSGTEVSANSTKFWSSVCCASVILPPWMDMCFIDARAISMAFCWQGNATQTAFCTLHKKHTIPSSRLHGTLMEAVEIGYGELVVVDRFSICDAPHEHSCFVDTSECLCSPSELCRLVGPVMGKLPSFVESCRMLSNPLEPNALWLTPGCRIAEDWHVSFLMRLYLFRHIELRWILLKHLESLHLRELTRFCT